LNRFNDSTVRQFNDMTSKNIVLIGFMGTGKSTVGKILAKKMGREIVDVDQKIEEKEKRRIAEIFEKDGEAAFRLLEKQAVKAVASGSKLVITTGGGVVLDSENVSMLKANGILVLLQATPQTIHQRVKGSRHRPLLRAGDAQDEISKLLEARRPYYEGADLKCATDGKTAQQVADEILKMLDGEGGSGKGGF
jgi:shikimate kinase